MKPSDPGSFSIGSVPYLNARPLVHALPGVVTYLHPSRLAQEFAAGKFDVALLPVAAALEQPGCRIVDGLAIASDGPVYSVILILHKSLEDIRTLALDSASKTSASLVKVLCERHWGVFPAYVPEGVPADAELWIGDQALAVRKKKPEAELIDLGSAWKEFTGLPFVYAAWVVAGASKMTQQDIDCFRQQSAVGLTVIPKIAGDAQELEYLTHCIQFRTGRAHRLGMERFAAELRTLNLCGAGMLPEWV